MRNVAWWVAAVFSGWLMPSVGLGFYVEGRPLEGADAGMELVVLRYEVSTPIPVRVATTTLPAGVTGAEDAIEAAFETWEAVACATIAFERGDDWTTTLDAHHAAHESSPSILVFWTDSDDYWDALVLEPVGRFVYTYDNATGVIRGGTVYMNSRDYTWSTDQTDGTLDIQSVVTALAGRSLGLTSHTEGNATYPSYRFANIDKRTLGADDIAGIQYLYLDDAGGTCSAVAPEEICPDDATDPECPPEVVTTPPEDGGTSDSGAVEEDGGGTVDEDGGTGVDAATTGADGGADTSSTSPDRTQSGCRCAIPGRSGSPDRARRVSLWLLAAAWLLILYARRRRARPHEIRRAYRHAPR